MSEQRRWRWIAPVAASYFFLGSFGVLLTVYEFPALRLDDLFILDVIAVPSILVGVLVSGFVLHKETSRYVYQRLPRIIGSTCGIIMLCSSGIIHSLKFTSVVLQSIATIVSRCALGCIYMVGIETLQAWVPDHPGTIATLGALFIFFTIRAGSSLLNYTLISIDKESACFSIECLISLGVFFISQYLERPLLGWSPWTSKYFSAQQRSGIAEPENEELKQTEQRDYESLANESTFNHGIQEVEMLPGNMEMPCFYPFVASIHFSFLFLYSSRLNSIIFAVSKGSTTSSSEQLLFWLLSIGLFGRVLCSYLLEKVYKRLRKVYTIMLFMQFAALCIISGSIFVRMPTMLTVTLALVHFILSSGTSTISFMMRYKNKNRKLNFVLSFHCIFSVFSDVINTLPVLMLHHSFSLDYQYWPQAWAYMFAIYLLIDENPVSRNSMKDLIHRIGFRKEKKNTADKPCLQDPSPC